MPNDKIMRILQSSEEISRKYSTHYRIQSLNEEATALAKAKGNGAPDFDATSKNIITL